MADATDRIYLTYKTRMTTENRLRRNGFIVEALMNWYTLCLIAISVANLSKLFEIAYVDMHVTILSVAVFGISLFAYGQKYGERADGFRSCYLELQELYNSAMLIPEKMQEYSKILARYHNQSDDDYDRMVVTNYFRGKKLEDSAGLIPVTFFMKSKFVLQTVSRILIVFVLFVGPPVGGFFWAKPLPHIERSAPATPSASAVTR